MNATWSTGFTSFADTITTFSDAGPSLVGTLKFGNTDAAAFHKFKGFTSAVITDAALSESVKQSLTDAIATGKSLRDWRNASDHLFDDQGYTRLNAWQAETIYRNETNMAYGAGQFAKLQQVSTRYPYYEYITMRDERVRASHRVLDGKIFASSDSEFYPPIGFGCRCTAKPISQLQAEKRGITKPSLITPEMRAELANAEFVGDKVGNYADWLQVKMAELPDAYKHLITQKLDDIQQTLAAVNAIEQQIAQQNQIQATLIVTPSDSPETIADGLSKTFLLNESLTSVKVGSIEITRKMYDAGTILETLQTNL